MPERVQLPARQVQMTARIKELHTQIKDHYHEIARLEQEALQLEQERLVTAPRGTYLHHRSDGTVVKVEAAILETDSDAIHIEYWIPRSLARRGEEDGYLIWLRSPEDRQRFTPQGENSSVRPM